MSLIKLSEKQKEFINILYARMKNVNSISFGYNIQQLQPEELLELKDLSAKGYIYIKDTDAPYIWYITIEKRLIDYIKNQSELEKSIEPDSESYVDFEKIEILKEKNGAKFSLNNLVTTLESININYKLGYYFVIPILIRVILDHSYPIFGSIFKSFGEVAAGYGGKSVKEILQRLEKETRKIGDLYAHSPITDKENIISKSSVDFKVLLDHYINELIKKL